MASSKSRPTVRRAAAVCLLLGLSLPLAAQQTVSDKLLNQAKQSQADIQKPSAGEAQPGDRSDEGNFSPARFIQIYEDTQGDNHRYQIYDPTRPHKQKTTQLSADEKSAIVIVPDGELIGTEPTLNKLYISAVLTSGDHTKPVPVAGYSELGEAKATSDAQRGMAFESTANLENMLLNMSYTAADIVGYFYCDAPTGQKAAGCEPEEDREIHFRSEPARDRDIRLQEEVNVSTTEGPLLKRLEERFRLYRPEITRVSNFFEEAQNLNLVEIMGTEIFWIDRASLQAIGAQYKDNMRVALEGSSTQPAKNQALQEMLERTKLVYSDFKEARQEIREIAARWLYGTGPTKDEEKKFPSLQNTLTLISKTQKDKSLTNAEKAKEEELKHLVKSYALEAYTRKTRVEALHKLKNLFAPGYVSLQSAGAKDGDILTVTVEVRTAEGNNPGVKSVFEIAVKRYGAKILLGSSFMFVQRRGVPAGAPDLNRVNFAPSPGMTYGLTFLKRGDRLRDKFFRGLGPGIGVNVSFLNFNDPGFDLAEQKFTKTTGVNVQVGAGIVGSLFDNKLQFTYGWNLNVDRKRQYWGIGFGFIEIGTELKRYIKK